MKLQITQKNINDADLPMCRYCPTENALVDAGFYNVNVGIETALAFKQNKIYNFSLSKELQKQILDFDANIGFVTGEYEITEL